MKQLTKKESLHHLKASMARMLYNSECFVCHTKIGFEKLKNGKYKLIGYRKGFTFHHRWYIAEKYEVHHKNYSDPLVYNQALAKLIIQDPSRFLFLCRTCHHRTMTFKDYTPDKFKRFSYAIGQVPIEDRE